MRSHLDDEKDIAGRPSFQMVKQDASAVPQSSTDAEENLKEAAYHTYD